MECVFIFFIVQCLVGLSRCKSVLSANQHILRCGLMGCRSGDELGCPEPLDLERTIQIWWLEVKNEEGDGEVYRCIFFSSYLTTLFQFRTVANNGSGMH